MEKLNKYIEQTVLKPTCSSSDIDKLVQEAKKYNFLGICVPPFWVKKAKREIGTSPTRLVTVVGFPLGYQMTEAKITETECAIKDGADEIDMVLNISAWKSAMNWPKIEVARLSKLCHDHERMLKVIIETAYLSDEEVAEVAKMCADAGADFVKTSTGFANAGAMEAHIALIRKSIPAQVGVKASGGIKTKEQAIAMIKAGADRIGTSSGIEIVS